MTASRRTGPSVVGPQWRRTGRWSVGAGLTDSNGSRCADCFPIGEMPSAARAATWGSAACPSRVRASRPAVPADSPGASSSPLPVRVLGMARGPDVCTPRPESEARRSTRSPDQREAATVRAIVFSSRTSIRRAFRWQGFWATVQTKFRHWRCRGRRERAPTLPIDGTRISRCPFGGVESRAGSCGRDEGDMPTLQIRWLRGGAAVTAEGQDSRLFWTPCRENRWPARPLSAAPPEPIRTRHQGFALSPPDSPTAPIGGVGRFTKTSLQRLFRTVPGLSHELDK